MAGTGMLAILIEIKVIELYKKNCWDVITLLTVSYTHLDVYKRQQ